MRKTVLGAGLPKVFWFFSVFVLVFLSRKHAEECPTKHTHMPPLLGQSSRPGLLDLLTSGLSQKSPESSLCVSR